MSAWLAVLVLACMAAVSACSAREGGAHGGESGAQKLLAEGDALFKQREYADATEVFRRAALAAEAEGDVATRTEASAMVARAYSIRHELELGRPWLERAESLATPDVPLGWSRYLAVRGIFERESGEQAKAILTFEALYAYCMQRDLPERAIDAAHHVAIVAKPEQQIIWAKRGIVAAELAESKRWLAVLWNNLGVTYEALDRPDDALEAYLRAREYHYETGTELNKLIADWAVGRAYRLDGNLVEARAWTDRTLEWAERRYGEDPTPPQAEWLGYALQEMGEVEALAGASGAAILQLEAAREKLVEGGLEKSWPEGLAELDARVAELAETPE